MVALYGTSLDLVPLSEAVSTVKLVPPELDAEAEVFFGRVLSVVDEPGCSRRQVSNR